jgi:hypothetical protein
VLLVAVSDNVAAHCAAAAPALQMLRVAHAAAARERVMVTRPLAVVLGERLIAADAEDVAYVAADVGAEVVRVDPKGDAASLAARLGLAIETAERRRAAE